MNKTFITFIFICLTTFSRAQSNNASLNDSVTNLFDYGMPIKSPEDNFKNLLYNFPKLIQNSNNIHLISYKYVADINNRKDVNKYLNKNINSYNINVNIFSRLSETDVENSSIQMSFPSDEKLNNVVRNDSIKSEIEKVAAKIQTGYKVYMLNFIVDGKPHEFYLFVNPQTNAVLKQASLFGFDITVYYAEYFNKKA